MQYSAAYLNDDYLSQLFGQPVTATVTSWQGSLLSAFWKVVVTGRDQTWHLVAKGAQSAHSIQVGHREVEFYKTMAAATPTIVPRCFDAQSTPEGWHLLLEDLSLTHEVPSRWPLPPTDAQRRIITRAFARFHAQWWNDPLHLIDQLPPNFVEGLQSLAADRLDAYLAAHAMTPARKVLLTRIVDSIPQLAARTLSKQNVTVTHGDAHVWNVFLSKVGDDARIHDWAEWRMGIAGRDLAYQMALHLFPDQRRLVELPTLRYYHECLQEFGVQDYAFDDLYDDYRRGVVIAAMVPLFQAKVQEIMPAIWWNHLERILAAVDDLDCLELL